MGDGTTRRCIEAHPIYGLRCERTYKHGGAHTYAHMGAMADRPIVWDDPSAALPTSRLRLALLVLMGRRVALVRESNDGSLP